MAVQDLYNKKKKEEQLSSIRPNRTPAQEDSDIENSEANDAQLAEADSVIENPPIDVEVEAPIKQEQKQEPKQDSEPSSIDSSTARTIGRLAAGATPTLFALLSHSSTSPIIRAGALAETQKQYAAGKPSKLVPIIGPSGEAIYETPEGALGEKVYQKPTSASTSTGKWLQGKTWIKDSSGKERLIDTLTNNVTNEVIDAYTKQKVDSSRPYVKPSVFARKDIGGGTTIVESDLTKQGNKVTTTPVLQGPGQYYNVGTEGQAKLIEKGLEAGQKQAQELYEKEEGVRATIASLKTNKDPRVLSQDIYGLARAAEAKDRLTEQDFKQLTGIDKETWFNRVKYAIDTGAFGDIEDLSKSFVPLAERILERTRRQKLSIPSRFAPKSKKAQEAIKNVLPLNEDRIDRQNKALDAILERLK